MSHYFVDLSRDVSRGAPPHRLSHSPSIPGLADLPEQTHGLDSPLLPVCMDSWSVARSWVEIGGIPFVSGSMAIFVLVGQTPNGTHCQCRWGGAGCERAVSVLEEER